MIDLELKSLSVSKLRLYLTCPRQYYYAYAEGIFQEETKFTYFGSYIHSVLELYLKELLKTKQTQALETLYSIASEKRKDYNEIPETGELSFFEADVFLNKFASIKFDPEKIYAIEKFFRIPFRGEHDIHIEGRIDRIDIEEAPDGDTLLHIIDYKTGKDELTESELKDDLQMKFYVYAAYDLYRRLYNRIRFTLYYLRDNTQISFETIYRDDFRAEIEAYVDTIREDKALEKNIGKHCTYCPAYKTCKPDKKKIKK